MKRGPYKQGSGVTRPGPGQPMKANGPPNLYPARVYCGCGSKARDNEGICPMCGHYKRES